MTEICLIRLVNLIVFNILYCTNTIVCIRISAFTQIVAKNKCPHFKMVLIFKFGVSIYI